MKKTIISFILMSTVIFFAACSSAPELDQDSVQTEQPEIATDSETHEESPKNEITDDQDKQNHTQNSAMKELGETIINAYSFPEMYILEKDEIKGEFGVSTENIDDIFAAVPMEYPGIERIFLAKISDDEARIAAEEELSKTFETIKAEYIDYLPDEYKKAKNVEIHHKNDMLFLIISEDYDSIIAFINE